MSNYVRVKLPGGCYFFTLVTFGRYKFLTSEPARPILRQVLEGGPEKASITDLKVIARHQFYVHH